MKRASAIFLLACASSGVLACEAILGIQDRTLRDASTADDVGASDASACDGDFCSCHPHAFCDDFDPYANVADLGSRWHVTGFSTSLIELGGTVTLDSDSGLAPSKPNALLTTVFLPTPLNGAGFLMGQFDAQVPAVIGIDAVMQIRVVAIDPADGAPPILDSGVSLFGGIFALVDFATKNGVGVAISRDGAYLGYALDLLSANAGLAQGKQFSNINPATLSGEFVQLEVIVAKRSSKKIPPVDCTPGPVLAFDASTPDAALPDDPVVVFVSTSLVPPACEVLNAELALPDWLASPIVVLGSVAKGQGNFSVEYDDFTLDFLTE